MLARRLPYISPQVLKASDSKYSSSTTQTYWNLSARYKQRHAIVSTERFQSFHVHKVPTAAFLFTAFSTLQRLEIAAVHVTFLQSRSIAGTMDRNGKTGANPEGSRFLKAEVASSPLSQSSGDTPPKVEAARDDVKILNSSPLSSVTRGFDNLDIRDVDPPYSLQHAATFIDPSQRDVKHRQMPTVNYGPRVPPGRRQTAPSAPSVGYGRGGSNQRKTNVWVSEEARLHQEYLYVRNSLKRMFKNADAAQWTDKQYYEHRAMMLEVRKKKLVEKAKSMTSGVHTRVPSINPQQQDTMWRSGLYGNFNQEGNRGRVLGEKTIWCVDWQNGKEDIAPWPCLAEMRWEGDDRAKTKVGRFLPLPREEGPPGLAWSQLQVVEHYPLDQVARIPTMEDIYLPVDEIDDEVKYDLITKDLEDAIDAYLES